METNGIGRPSTFQTTVDILKKRIYVELLDKSLKPTEYGKLVILKLKDAETKILDIEYTSNLENHLDNIANGNKEYKKMLDNFWLNFEKEVINAESKIKKTIMPLEFIGKKCPKCQEHELVVRRNKTNGNKFFACQGFPKCKYIESDPTFKKPFFKNKK